MERAEVERWAMDIRTERVTVNRCVASGPCFVYHLAVASDSSGATTATIYNGISPKAEIKIDMTTIDDYYAQHDYWPPLYFERGIYVDVGAKTTSVIVRYHAHKP